MHLDDGLDDVSEVLDGLSDFDGLDDVEVFEQSASVHVLEEQIEAVIGLEEPVELDYFRVIKRAVQFDFFDELIDDVVLD